MDSGWRPLYRIAMPDTVYQSQTHSSVNRTCSPMELSLGINIKKDRWEAENPAPPTKSLLQLIQRCFLLLSEVHVHVLPKLLLSSDARCSNKRDLEYGLSRLLNSDYALWLHV